MIRNGSLESLLQRLRYIYRYNLGFLIGDVPTILVNMLLDGGGLRDPKIIE